MTTLFLTLILLSSSLAHASWELNDVSYLFPLPKAKDGKNFLLKTKSLFPTVHRKSIEDLIQGHDFLADPYETLRVVGMRIDPCFKFHAIEVEQKCSPQLRLIWQPIIQEGTDKVTTHDGALHTFYTLSKMEFSLLSSQLMELKKKNELMGISTWSKPLFIHPAFHKLERRNSFNEELKAIILKSVDPSKLVRFTFMKRLTPEVWWVFGGEDRSDDGKFYPIQIARMNGDIRQDFFNTDFISPLGFRGNFVNEPQTQIDNIANLFKGYGIHDNPESIGMVKEGLKSLNRIENPRIHSPESIDCASCHITDPGKHWLMNEKAATFKKANTTGGKYVQKFLTHHSLKNLTNFEKRRKSIRAFGYFEDNVSINQRVINESAEVADKMNLKF